MGRRKIGSRKVENIEDNIDMIDDSLSEYSVVASHGHRFAELSEVSVKPKKMDVHLIQQAETECICDVCLKAFYHKADETEWYCPNCGTKYQSEALEELHVTQDGTETSQKLADCAEKRRVNGGIFLVRKKENWEDNRKEQISLEQGSAEYLEYQEDLQEMDPFRGEDEFHQKLEQYNEDLVTKNYDTDDNPEAPDDYESLNMAVKLQHLEEMQKRDLHPKAVRSAIAAASLTETLTDDQLARAITTDNVILYDKGVKPDEYVEALTDYVIDGPSK